MKDWKEEARAKHIGIEELPGHFDSLHPQDPDCGGCRFLDAALSAAYEQGVERGVHNQIMHNDTFTVHRLDDCDRCRALKSAAKEAKP